MDKPKGGRGKAAPYDTKLMRVPVGLEDQVQELIERYRLWVSNGNTIIGTDNPPRLLDAATPDKPVNNLLPEIEQVRSRSQLEQVEQQADKPVNEFNGEQVTDDSQVDKPINEFNGEPMRVRQLANFLGYKSHSHLFRIKSQPNFEQWSRERDPHGVAWRYDAESKLFYPVP